MSLIVLFAILFPTIHSYEHFPEQNSGKQKTEIHSLNKNEFKLSNHSTEKCSICDFKFSTFTSTLFSAFQFYKSTAVIYYSFFYFKTPSTFFKGSLFALRAPPLNLK
ncbi:hypothetical protein J2W48_003519 [Flavobacterium piscis]|uniref:Uncharacterized protein n=1 Tax=Flavobacterium piscis TaxID=1114874 RepID=A0ABU1YBE9_9FLAO|nr:hypothetical protein [Flavobacterium piscis]